MSRIVFEKLSVRPSQNASLSDERPVQYQAWKYLGSVKVGECFINQWQGVLAFAGY